MVNALVSEGKYQSHNIPSRLFTVRSKTVNDCLRAHLGTIKQVVNFGAGYDTLGFRNWENVKYFEIDSPQVLDFKTSCISQNSIIPVPFDFANKSKWHKALLEKGFNSKTYF
jgi:O-methyltransferase involved in polyketide biosynthesis